MNKLSKVIAISAFSLAVLALPSVATAQWYPQQGPYYGNQGRDLRGIADQLRTRSRQFDQRVDSYVDRGYGNRGGGYYGNRNYNNDLKSLAGDFRRAADNFRSKYGNGRNLRNSEDAARRLLDAGSRLDNALRASRVDGRLTGEWNSMRGMLNQIANTYGYNYNRGNQRYPQQQRYKNNNGDWRNMIPFPLPF
ncbi:MAG TPA: hypothetical protein VK918_07585 [Pyrinomonadaceae bacterium]|nr:hypothetical protein [Pyrinomonadaceae bacterium]